jgi:hypothetical protein
MLNQIMIAFSWLQLATVVTVLVWLFRVRTPAAANERSFRTLRWVIACYTVAVALPAIRFLFVARSTPTGRLLGLVEVIMMIGLIVLGRYFERKARAA